MRLLTAIFLFAVVTFSFTDFPKDRYLPVSIYLLDTTGAFNKQVKMATIGSFKKYNVKVLTENEMGELIKAEAASLIRRLHESGGNIGDFNQVKHYMSTHGNKVGTSISLLINISDSGIVNDTVKWNSRTLPIDMVNFPKGKLKVIALDSSRMNSIFEITDQVVEKIIASGELAKE